jgi:RNA polymerase-binding transcription factor DksA
MESYVKNSLVEWKKEICSLLNEIDDEYEKMKSELQVYSYKFSITKQVVQSTLNEEIIRNIRELYHKPFEQKYSKLKADIKDLEERKKVFQMFIDKIDQAMEKGE